MSHIPGAGPDLTADPLWHSEFEALAFTAEALLAHPEDDDGDLGRLSRRVVSVLADWEEIDAAGRGLRRASIHAAARIRAADVALDTALNQFARDVLELVGGNRDDELYSRLFPESHEDLVELGADAALPTVMLIVMALDQDEAIDASLRKHAEGLRAAMQFGNGALTERADVLAEVGRHQARVEAWKETSKATRRNLMRAITRLAEERSQSPRWVKAFFSVPPPED